uniref:Lipase domain-containing protein n=3 Tax=Photinus pyralis TaxID=7054 RepID=A0A1Y1KRX3_PHOPY
MVRNPDLKLPVNCKRRLKPQLHFHLYNREHLTTPIELNVSDAKELADGKDIKILIHGWLSSSKDQQMHELKDAYLQQYDCNVILIDWSKSAKQLYHLSYCHASNIAQFTSKVLCHWHEKINLDLNKIHIVGHSMGAHIAGLLSQEVKPKCRAEVGRITGLDPSRALFSSPGKDLMLSKSNAKMVDIIHTDNEVFGILNNHGDLDFYPNCGQRQPGCELESPITGDTLLSEVMCSHIRSLEYMVESIRHGNAIAASCLMCPRLCRPDYGNDRYMPMGEKAVLKTQSRKSKAFTLSTYSTPPYFKVWQPYADV